MVDLRVRMWTFKDIQSSSCDGSGLKFNSPTLLALRQLATLKVDQTFRSLLDHDIDGLRRPFKILVNQQMKCTWYVECFHTLPMEKWKCPCITWGSQEDDDMSSPNHPFCSIYFKYFKNIPQDVHTLLTSFYLFPKRKYIYSMKSIWPFLLLGFQNTWNFQWIFPPLHPHPSWASPTPTVAKASPVRPGGATWVVTGRRLVL